MSLFCENDHAYVEALNKLRFSEETKSRITQALLDTRQPIKRRAHRPVRIALTVAAACVVLTITALAAVPSIWKSVQANLGTFAPYAQTLQGADASDQGIEIQVLNALFDDVRGWVYFSVRDTEGDRLNQCLSLNGHLNISAAELPEENGNGSSGADLGSATLISYDPDSKTALFVQSVLFHKDTTPSGEAQLTVNAMTTQDGYLSRAVSCASVTGEVLESRPATKEDTVLSSPSDTVNGSYDDTVLPDRQVVLTPGQTPMEIEGTEDMWISSMGFASDGCFHVRLEYAEGIQESDIGIWGKVDTIDGAYGEKYGAFLVRRVENGQDILFPLIHADEAGRLSLVQLYGQYTRPGVEITGDWSIDFEMEYYASKGLNWTGDLNGLQVTQITVSPLSVTMSSTGKGSFATAELCAVLKDGSVVNAEPSIGAYVNTGGGAGEELWKNYSTWKFADPVDVENVVSLTLLGESIPVEIEP